MLEARGYTAVSPSLTLAAPVRGEPMPADVAFSAGPTEEWLQLYGSQVSAERRIELADTFARMPRERVFATGFHNGRPACTAVGAFVAGAVAVECVFTSADARGKGLAGKVLAALDAWAASLNAPRLLLAVAEENRAGRRLYEKAGYRQISGYHYREKR
jgi:GNAT superfamily N-acetyltransferase